MYPRLCRHRFTFCAGVVFSCSLLAALLGCQKPRESGASKSGTEETDNQLFAELSPETTPEQAAEFALQAIAGKDTEALISLIAVDTVRGDVQSITRGRSSMEGMAEKSVGMAAGAIRLNINFLDPEPRSVGQAVIDGDRATVAIHGQAAGKPLQKELYLVRENNLWKLVPSHR